MATNWRRTNESQIWSQGWGNNYEYVLHRNKGLFLRSLSDVLNVVECCVTKELKDNGYLEMDTFPNVVVTRFVNNKEDNLNWENKFYFHSAINTMIKQMLDDNIQRHTIES